MLRSLFTVVYLDVDASRLAFKDVQHKKLSARKLRFGRGSGEPDYCCQRRKSYCLRYFNIVSASETSKGSLPQLSVFPASSKTFLTSPSTM